MSMMSISKARPLGASSGDAAGVGAAPAHAHPDGILGRDEVLDVELEVGNDARSPPRGAAHRLGPDALAAVLVLDAVGRHDLIDDRILTLRERFRQKPAHVRDVALGRHGNPFGG